MELYGINDKLTVPYILFSSRKLSPEVSRTDCGGLDYTASRKIWVSLISVTKRQETSVNKCHEHILLIIFMIFLLIYKIYIYFL